MLGRCVVHCATPAVSVTLFPFLDVRTFALITLLPAGGAAAERGAAFISFAVAICLVGERARRAPERALRARLLLCSDCQS